MTPEQNARIMRDTYHKLETGEDYTALDKIYADDATFTLYGHATPICGEGKGMTGAGSHYEVRQLASASLRFDTYKFTIDNIVAGGDFVVLQAHGFCTAMNGKVYNQEYCLVYKLENGRVKAVGEYLDTEMVRACMVDYLDAHPDIVERIRREAGSES
jgi:ketosteroid isomerase-like protein